MIDRIGGLGDRPRLGFLPIGQVTDEGLEHDYAWGRETIHLWRR